VSPEAEKVVNLMDAMADDLTGPIEWGSINDVAGRIGRLRSALKQLARTLGADDVAERMEADDEREMVALFGEGYRERWAREREEREGAPDETQRAYAYARVSDRRKDHG